MKHTKTPTAEDRYIGERIREARIALDMSQGDLGQHLGVSFQQVQKYENGKNRINGARLGLLATALQRPLGYFFPNVTDVRATSDPIVSTFLATKDGQFIATKFPRIKSQKVRRAILDLITEATEQA